MSEPASKSGGVPEGAVEAKRSSATGAEGKDLGFSTLAVHAVG